MAEAVIVSLFILFVITFFIAVYKSISVDNLEYQCIQEKAKTNKALYHSKELEAINKGLKENITELEGKVAILEKKVAEYLAVIEEKNTVIEAKNAEILAGNEAKNAEIQKWENEEYLMGVFKTMHNDAYEEYSNLLTKSEELEKMLHPYNCGVYEPEFDFDDSETYKNRLLQTHEDAKAMVKDKRAIFILEGDNYLYKKIAEIALRCFNSECDKCISEVKWNNVFKYEQKINKAFNLINSNLEDVDIRILPRYLGLRLKELHLAYEYKLKKQREKEEQDNIRALMREQEKAEREIQSALIKADAEEKKYLARFEKISSTLDSLQGDRLLKAEEQIRELEARLAEVRASKERALSMAEQTKRGYVYVISNLGSFGDNIYKIGLTRRLDPMERIRELGDASVPFPFDVHAMIFSEDAPKLEATLHQRFSDRRVNMVNNRKEFFNVSLKEIADVVAEYNATIEFTLIAEASDYSQTLAINDKSNE
jgi:chromosome segregation ATPase